ICCTLRDDLLREVARLAGEGRFDYLLIESTGISEPLPVAETFTFTDDSGRSLSEYARLDTMVTVVDAVNLLRDLDTLETLGERGVGLDEHDERTIVDLLIDQIEFASVLILNKTDLVTPAAAGRLEALLRKLNPGAKLLRAVRGQVPLTEVLHTGRFDFEKAAAFSEWLTGETHTPETEEYGIHSFAFTARRPFHPQRLWRALVDDHLLDGVVRSKGIAWLAGATDSAGIWSQAGSIITLEPGGDWWAAVPRDEYPDDPAIVAEIDRYMLPDIGDRRQELVFIGIEMDEARLREKLAACLLSDGEMAHGRRAWRRFKNPFPGWND
ncbi:MAG: GTP-binding protein, partial [Anaerolineae bacterium]|nr:GTP-binding protein [Anaerolineae bacterium]